MDHLDGLVWPAHTTQVRGKTKDAVLSPRMVVADRTLCAVHWGDP